MSQDNNEVLSAVILLERVIPRLHANTRETIRKQQLGQVEQSLSMVLRQLVKDCKDPLVLTPIMEVLQLIEDVTADDTFVETDAETKELIVGRLDNALTRLYLFAGKFYMDHEFTWAMTKTDVLRHIVDACMDNGFYFGYDKELQQNGEI
jgi:hypothetical protein